MKNIIRTLLVLAVSLFSYQLQAQSPTDDNPQDPGMEIMSTIKSQHIYPNPSYGNFSLWLQPNTGATTIRIFDWQGFVVYQEKVDVNGNGQIVNINLTNNKNGRYIIRIETNKEVSSRSVVIQK